jgi:hypothetical protein
MADLQRTRVREREPASESIYDEHVRFHLSIRERSLTGKVVVKPADRPFQSTRQGYLCYMLSRNHWKETALKDWNVFIHDIRRHSGKHRHQGGLVIFVVEGEGYTIVNGERIDWQAGDLILLPIQPGGCEHQHFNRYADQSCKWIAFNYKPLHDEVASFTEQREEAPDFAG